MKSDMVGRLGDCVADRIGVRVVDVDEVLAKARRLACLFNVFSSETATEMSCWPCLHSYAMIQCFAPKRTTSRLSRGRLVTSVVHIAYINHKDQTDPCRVPRRSPMGKINVRECGRQG